MNKGVKNKCSIEDKLSWSSYSNLFPLVIMSNWSFCDCRCPNIYKEINCFPVQSISSSHRAQVITSCSTSLQQIVSVADKATLLFSVERISKFFFSVWACVCVWISCLLWNICLMAHGGDVIDLTCCWAIFATSLCTSVCLLFSSVQKGSERTSCFCDVLPTCVCVTVYLYTHC